MRGYGKKVLKELSKQLNLEFGKGFSVDNLQNMRQFFLTYSIYETASRISSSDNVNISSRSLTKIEFTGKPSIQQTTTEERKQSENKEIAIPSSIIRKFNLSWSHYIKLIRIKNLEERNFYEIESAANNWTLKELQRQFDSGLYERLALSRDKEGIKQLAEKGQIIKSLPTFSKTPTFWNF